MSTNVLSTTKTVNSSEVGWQFVPQYYNYVNKQPERLHCFYTKTSTFVHGAEGDDSKPCYGQQEIHNRITEIGFQDCKVFIHSVDAQASANGGIIIQVIGEMSNNDAAWRKFVQTFFLAEQPNGYFVLNDVFRYLKEESADGDADTEGDLEAPEPNTPERAAPVVEEAAPVIEAPPTPEPIREPSPEPPVKEEEQEEEEVVPTPEPNGVHGEPEEPPVVEETPEPEPAPVAPSPAPPSPAPAPPAPVVAPTPPAPALAPAPALPKTWANLAAANSNKWGAAVAQESRGTTESPVAATAPPPPKQAPFQPPQNQGGPNRGPRQEHPVVVAAQNVTTAQCFVKGVTETVSSAALSHLLTTRFGPIKEIEIVRSKACAFLEFTTIEAAKKAILASLSPGLGGEGGLRLPDGERINVETKKERSERPPSRPRGGAPPSQSTRGGGGGAPRGGRGAGAPPARGARGGPASAPAK